MVKVTVGSNYEYLKTLKKVVIDVLVYGIPQLANIWITANPDLASMTVAGVISLAVKSIIDYLKHK